MKCKKCVYFNCYLSPWINEPKQVYCKRREGNGIWARGFISKAQASACKDFKKKIKRKQNMSFEEAKRKCKSKQKRYTYNELEARVKVLECEKLNQINEQELFAEENGFSPDCSPYYIAKEYKKKIEQFKNEAKIYIITTFEKSGREWKDEFAEIRDYGCIRTIGWFWDFDAAETRVINNACDIWETCYDYAVIEEKSAGLYASDDVCRYYKFNRGTGKYEPTQEVEVPILPTWSF